MDGIALTTIGSNLYQQSVVGTKLEMVKVGPKLPEDLFKRFADAILTRQKLEAEFNDIKKRLSKFVNDKMEFVGQESDAEDANRLALRLLAIGEEGRKTTAIDAEIKEYEAAFVEVIDKSHNYLLIEEFNVLIVQKSTFRMKSVKITVTNNSGEPLKNVMIIPLSDAEFNKLYPVQDNYLRRDIVKLLIDSHTPCCECVVS